MARDVGCEIILDFIRDDIHFEEGEFNKDDISEDLKKYIEEHILDVFLQQFERVSIKSYRVIVDDQGILIEGILSVPQDITIDDMRTYIESIFDLSSNASDFTGSVEFTEYPTITTIGGKSIKNKRGKSKSKSKRKSKSKSKRKSKSKSKRKRTTRS